MPMPCSAETATGSPSPSSQASISPASAARPSALLATRITRAARLRSSSASVRSTGVTPARASIMNRQTSAASTARSVSARIRPGRLASVDFLEPGGVDDGEAQRPQPPGALAQVAGHARLVVDQRQPPADQPVEQRRLADVGPADDGEREGHRALSLLPGPPEGPAARSLAAHRLIEKPEAARRGWRRTSPRRPPPAPPPRRPAAAPAPAAPPSDRAEGAQQPVGARHPEPPAGEDRPVVRHRRERLAAAEQARGAGRTSAAAPTRAARRSPRRPAPARRRRRAGTPSRRPARPARRSPRGSSRPARRSVASSRTVRPLWFEA